MINFSEAKFVKVPTFKHENWSCLALYQSKSFIWTQKLVLHFLCHTLIVFDGSILNDDITYDEVTIHRCNINN